MLKHNLVREALKRTCMSKGIEITTLADIPSKGTEIGSSNSVIVGLLHALYSYKGELKTEEDLAREACHIESEN